MHGTFNEYGYRILADNGDEVYRAGNSPYESTSVVPLGAALPLRTIRVYCALTGAEMAIGGDAPEEWRGASYTATEDEEA